MSRNRQRANPTEKTSSLTRSSQTFDPTSTRVMQRARNVYRELPKQEQREVCTLFDGKHKLVPAGRARNGEVWQVGTGKTRVLVCRDKEHVYVADIVDQRTMEEAVRRSAPTADDFANAKLLEESLMYADIKHQLPGGGDTETLAGDDKETVVGGASLQQVDLACESLREALHFLVSNQRGLTSLQQDCESMIGSTEERYAHLEHDVSNRFRKTNDLFTGQKKRIDKSEADVARMIVELEQRLVVVRDKLSEVDQIHKQDRVSMKREIGYAVGQRDQMEESFRRSHRTLACEIERLGDHQEAMEASVQQVSTTLEDRIAPLASMSTVHSEIVQDLAEQIVSLSQRIDRVEALLPCVRSLTDEHRRLEHRLQSLCRQVRRQRQQQWGFRWSLLWRGLKQWLRRATGR